jgi:hypothetical protein
MTQSLAARVASRVLTAGRVAERFIHRTAGYDGKFVGKDARLQWSRDYWYLEELPQKGKKKLRSGRLQNPTHFGRMTLDWWIPGNILQIAKLAASDDYADIKKKIEKAYEEAIARTEKADNPKERAALAEATWIRTLKWDEDMVFYLNVVPEGTDPFTVEGKDFKVLTKWTGFSAYSPQSDFQQAQPYYSQIESSSPTAARKFFVMTKSNPALLKSIPYGEFGDWLRKQKIQYKNNHSQWT